MPTGVALRDPREQLFAAARRVLLRDGVTGVTSRAVTDEAGVAKGVLHRHFPDFDAFLVALVLDRLDEVRRDAAALQERVGTGTVAGNLTEALVGLLDPAMVATAALVIARDELRSRLRAAGTARLPLIGESTAAVADYLAAEREAGRLAADADVAVLAPMLIGTVHLLATERADRTPAADDVHRSVLGVVGPVLR